MKFRLPKRIAGFRVRRPVHRLTQNALVRSGLTAAAVVAPAILGTIAALRSRRAAAAGAASTSDLAGAS